MAKLSLKGICSLSHQIIDKDGKVNIHNIEMNQDDFEDCVMLTVGEANLLFNVIDGFFDLRLPTTKEIVALNKLKVRVERIEQTEKSK